MEHGKHKKGPHKMNGHMMKGMPKGMGGKNPAMPKKGGKRRGK